MTPCQKFEDRLEAFHDGELSGMARWRVGRHVAGCERCREEIEALHGIGTWLREDAGAAPAPDLWAGIAARLPELDAALARRSAPEPVPVRRRRFGALLGPWPVGVGGLVAAAAVLAIWLQPAGLPLRDEVVEELDAMGRPVAVLPSDEKSTIIWVLDPTPVASREGENRAQL